MRFAPYLLVSLLVSSQAFGADPLVDCSDAKFQQKNSVKSLMGWADRAEKQATAAAAGSGARKRACDKLVGQRGSAHCQVPDDAAVRAKLESALALCKAEPAPPPPAAKKAAPTTGSAHMQKPLVDCRKKRFRRPNSAKSLLGWSRGAEDEINRNLKQGLDISTPCKRAIDMRGSAHCKEPKDNKIRKALESVMNVCAPKTSKSKPILNCKDPMFSGRKDSPIDDLVRATHRALSSLKDERGDVRLGAVCKNALSYAGSAHCRMPDHKGAKDAVLAAQDKCESEKGARAKARANAIAAERARIAKAKANRKITKFPKATFSGGDRKNLEAQMRKALRAGRVAKSDGELLRVQAMGKWRSGRYTDTKVQYQKIMGTVLWKNGAGDGVCRYTSYNFIRDKSGGKWTPLRFKSFCNGCPEGWTKCP
ncbi:MAG: hypothetical protein RIT81_02770 [Deltaproteobacteria bacterium]